MCVLNLKRFLKSIHHIPYMLIKMDVPYMPKDFPKTYLHKDMDIIVSGPCFFTLQEAVEYFLEDYPQFKVKIVENPDDEGHICFKLIDRVPSKNKIHYQFDITEHCAGIPHEFMEEIIWNRQEHTSGLYYVPHPADEIVFRLLAYKRKKSKSWHLDYVREHAGEADLKELEQLNLLEYYYALIK